MPFVNVTVRGRVVETVPPQVVLPEPAMTVNTFPGSVSDRLTPVYGVLVELYNVIASVVVPPAWKLGGVKALDKPTS